MITWEFDNRGGAALPTHTYTGNTTSPWALGQGLVNFAHAPGEKSNLVEFQG